MHLLENPKCCREVALVLFEEQKAGPVHVAATGETSEFHRLLRLQCRPCVRVLLPNQGRRQHSIYRRCFVQYFAYFLQVTCLSLPSECLRCLIRLAFALRQDRVPWMSHQVVAAWRSTVGRSRCRQCRPPGEGAFRSSEVPMAALTTGEVPCLGVQNSCSLPAGLPRSLPK